MFTGTITAMSYPSSSFMMGAEAQSQPYYGIDKKYNSYGPEYPDSDNRYYNSYGPTSDYRMNDNINRKPYLNDNSYESQYQPSYKIDYKSQYPSYEKDDRDKSKDSKSISLNKIKCINTNININGNNAGNVSIGNKGQGYSDAYPSGGSGHGEKHYDAYNKKNKDFDCAINNNNNNNNVVTGDGGDGNQTIPPEPTTNNVYVVWQDNTPGNSEIFFAVSNDNGQTFSTPLNISKNTGSSIGPQISSEGNNVYIVWQDNTPGSPETFFAVSNDNGQTFSTPINISNTPQPAILSSLQNPQISSEGNNVYVVWEDYTFGSPEIFFAVSNDNGQTFSSPPDNLSNDTGFSRTPQISAEGNNVYVVWHGSPTPGSDEIFFAVSNDNGQTFSTPPDNLSNNTGFSRFPQISAEGNNVYVVWQDTISTFDETFFVVSNDNGQTFSTPPDNLSNNPTLSENPQISSEGNNVYVVWSDTTPGNRDIFFAASYDNGQTFSILGENISNNTEDSSFPQISTEGNNIYVVWEDDTPGNPETFFAVSNDNGQTFSTPINISNTPGSTNFGLHQQQISSEGNNVYVVWRDETDIPFNSDIFFVVSNDNGQIFSTPSENISNNAGDSRSPKISSSTS
jgi:hypothetical protein